MPLGRNFKGTERVRVRVALMHKAKCVIKKLPGITATHSLELSVCLLRCIAVDSTFRRRLKAQLFSRAYGVSINI